MTLDRYSKKKYTLDNNKIQYIQSRITDHERFLAILSYYLQNLNINNHKDEIKIINEILNKIKTEITEKQTKLSCESIGDNNGI